MNTKRIDVRLINRHPAATYKEIAVFKKVKPLEGIRLLAASQVVLTHFTSMFGYELMHEGHWRKFGPRAEQRVKEETNRLYALWSPLDDLKPRSKHDK
jgi:hypothetical protein